MGKKSFDTFVTLARECLKKEQKERPSMYLIVKNLESALEYQILTDKQKRDQLAREEEDKRKILYEASGENPDDDINRWSSGKEENLQALIATLHNVLGPESGWKPVLLTETTCTPTVLKGHYDRAISITNPKKLKQRRASIKEEYICSRVFEILKVGFEKFESDEREQLRILGENHDDNIKSWSIGKEGDLRALLSNLENILEPESGWEPVSLTETTSAADVRELYETAVSILQPRKLRRRGATIEEMYICGKVVEILKAGLEKFESDERDKFLSLGVKRIGRGGNRRQIG